MLDAAKPQRTPAFLLWVGEPHARLRLETWAVTIHLLRDVADLGAALRARLPDRDS